MGLTVKKKCRERCDLSKHRIKCALSQSVRLVTDVEFHVLYDDGKTLTLANGGGGPDQNVGRWGR